MANSSLIIFLTFMIPNTMNGWVTSLTMSFAYIMHESKKSTYIIHQAYRCSPTISHKDLGSSEIYSCIVTWKINQGLLFTDEDNIRKYAKLAKLIWLIRNPCPIINAFKSQESVLVMGTTWTFLQLQVSSICSLSVLCTFQIYQGKHMDHGRYVLMYIFAKLSPF